MQDSPKKLEHLASPLSKALSYNNFALVSSSSYGKFEFQNTNMR